MKSSQALVTFYSFVTLITFCWTISFYPEMVHYLQKKSVDIHRVTKLTGTWQSLCYPELTSVFFLDFTYVLMQDAGALETQRSWTVYLQTEKRNTLIDVEAMVFLTTFL